MIRALVAALALAAASPALAAAAVGDAPPASVHRVEGVQLAARAGCGSRGGSGYRGPSGGCVGDRQLTQVCGADPSKGPCTFEGGSRAGGAARALTSRSEARSRSRGPRVSLHYHAPRKATRSRGKGRSRR